MDRVREEENREQTSDKGRAMELRETETEDGMKRGMVRDEHGHGSEAPWGEWSLIRVEQSSTVGWVLGDWLNRTTSTVHY